MVGIATQIAVQTTQFKLLFQHAPSSGGGVKSEVVGIATQIAVQTTQLKLLFQHAPSSGGGLGRGARGGRFISCAVKKDERK